MNSGRPKTLPNPLDPRNTHNAILNMLYETMNMIKYDGVGVNG